jgi:carbamoyl-phosphate synthase large subunit
VDTIMTSPDGPSLRILVTGAGGSPATNFIRSLRKAPQPVYLIGVDASKYTLCRAETDERHLVPLTGEPDYADVLFDIVDESRPDLIYIQTDYEIRALSPRREELHARRVRTLLPDDATIALCQDKYRAQKAWEAAGLKVPRSLMIDGPEDVEQAFRDFGAPVWIRAISSAGGGAGSFRAEDVRQALHWVEYCAGWGTFCAAEYLSPDSVTWTGLYKDGELIVAQGRARLYWELGNRAPSGVTGVTGTGVTVSDPVVDELAQRVIAAVDRRPSGIFAVDLTYDRRRVPNPTEINIGRFFTTHGFFTEAGLNLPWFYVCAALGRPVPPVARKINPLPAGLAWVRGVDFLPVLTTVRAIEEQAAGLVERRRRLSR